MLMNCIQFQSGSPGLKFLKQFAVNAQYGVELGRALWFHDFCLSAIVRHTVFIILLLAGGMSVALADPLPMPNSEVDYPGASANSAFVAKEPYLVNIRGTMIAIPLWGASRKNDFSGNAHFVNQETGRTDPAQIQAWDPVFATSFTPYLTGSYNLNDDKITNAGFPGRVDKRILNGSTVTMVRYNAGDGITGGKCRSQLNAYAIPPRTHVRWELEVAFGNPDGVNDWILSPTWKSPVLFWQMYSMNQSHPPLAANVDTDLNDPTKLMITFFQRVGTATQPTEIVRVGGISRHTMVPIVIEAFLDERTAANGGKGLLQISINNTLVLEKTGPTLSSGTNSHWWSLAMYLWNDSLPSPYTRSSFWKAAKMTVFPMDTLDRIRPSAPLNLTATAPDSTKVSLSWGASTDNVAVTGYKIHRDGIGLGYSTTPSFTDMAVVEGVSYNYVVQAYDAAGNFSVASNIATVKASLATVDTSRPSGPLNLTATAPDSTKVNLLWGASTDNVAVTGYKIYRNGTGVGYSTTSSFTDTAAVEGATYYVVQAYDAAGNFSVASNIATVKAPSVTADTIRPSSPANLTATAPASAKVSLSWSIATDNVAVTGYKIYRDGVGVGYSTTPSFTDTAVVEGATYNYLVQAYDAAGNFSVASNMATIKTPLATDIISYYVTYIKKA
jgi:chitodextrinase